MRTLTAVFAVVLAAAGVFAAPAPKETPKADRNFTSVNIEYKGSKVWTPSTFIVKKGESVAITLINQAPSGRHGFAIEGFEDQGVKVEVGAEEPVTVRFKAAKGGLYKVYCQLHPAHVGGQLLVLE